MGLSLVGARAVISRRASRVAPCKTRLRLCQAQLFLQVLREVRDTRGNVPGQPVHEGRDRFRVRVFHNDYIGLGVGHGAPVELRRHTFSVLAGRTGIAACGAKLAEVTCSAPAVRVYSLSSANGTPLPRIACSRMASAGGAPGDGAVAALRPS